jgi:hypothetical protein
MQPQTIFNNAYNRIIAQGVPSQTPDDGFCVYSGPNGTACGVGILLDPDMRKRVQNLNEGDDTSITTLAADYPDHFPSWVQDNVPLLTGIQQAHDKSHPDFIPGFKAAMAEVAEYHNLEIPDATTV